ncbi:E3 SUMO-protein ligase NSE2 isoform X3 [Heterodontus francisci]|uniref:E3 SUMO-protein ligase NSE2 isoform X3 n=1 Tax=Heterodontus francisci TaxID=7792 RepID=UPI00355BA92A
MPGRSTIMPVISFNSVDSAVSSLKTCHVSINTGIEVTTDVALALTEHEGAVEEISNMEKLMLDYVSMDRELEQFIQAVGDVTHQVLASPKARVLCSAAVKSAWDDCHLQIKQERPERMPDLKALVDKRFNELNNLNKDEDLIKNDKYICFKGQLKEMKKQDKFNRFSEGRQAVRKMTSGGSSQKTYAAKGCKDLNLFLELKFAEK